MRYEAEPGFDPDTTGKNADKISTILGGAVPGHHDLVSGLLYSLTHSWYFLIIGCLAYLLNPRILKRIN